MLKVNYLNIWIKDNKKKDGINIYLVSPGRPEKQENLECHFDACKCDNLF